MGKRLVLARSLANSFELFVNFLPILRVPQIDEVHHDNSAQIPQPELTGDLARRFQIRL